MSEQVQNIVHFNDQYNKIVQECVQIRKSINHTQSDMAKWLNVDRRKIIALEDGEINISLLLEYADKLSIKVNLNFEIQ